MNWLSLRGTTKGISSPACLQPLKWRRANVWMHVKSNKKLAKAQKEAEQQTQAAKRKHGNHKQRGEIIKYTAAKMKVNVSVNVNVATC